MSENNLSRGGGIGRRAGLRILSPQGGVSSTLTRDTLHTLSKLTSIALLGNGLYTLATSLNEIFFVLPIMFQVKTTTLAPETQQDIINKFILLTATTLIETSYGLTLLTRAKEKITLIHIAGGILLFLFSVIILHQNPIPQL